MAVLYEADLSDDGIATFAGDAVDHVRINVTTLPPRADALDVTAPHEVIRVGWIALGGTYAEGDEGELTYNYEKMWIEFDQQLMWTSVPSHPASHIRWRIWPGGVVHVLVVS